MAISRKYLLSYGEVGLKHGNRRYFVDLLIDNLRHRLKPLGAFQVHATWGRIFLDTDIDALAAEPVLAKTFGLTGFATVRAAPLRYEALEHAALETVSAGLIQFPKTATFKIESRRPNKTFALTSEDLNIRLGQAVVDRFPTLSAKMVKPDLTVRVEVRQREAYIFPGLNRSGGGLPVGCSGKGLLLLSGGIDSPVAGWMMLKRGMSVMGVHFLSPPYTSPRSRQKSVDLAALLSKWGGEPQLLLAPFTDVQVAIGQGPRKSLSTLLAKKAMMEISEKLCQKFSRQALITGDNMGQVASQTFESLRAVGHGVERPLFRPLIGLDKTEIIDLSMRIGTYDTSIQPYDDCCTLFLPPKPEIRPTVDDLQTEYRALNLSPLIEQCVEKTEALALA